MRTADRRFQWPKREERTSSSRLRLLLQRTAGPAWRLRRAAIGPTTGRTGVLEPERRRRLLRKPCFATPPFAMSRRRRRPLSGRRGKQKDPAIAEGRERPGRSQCLGDSPAASRRGLALVPMKRFDLHRLCFPRPNVRGEPPAEAWRLGRVADDKQGRHVAQVLCRSGSARPRG